jgi:hypothetical protein
MKPLQPLCRKLHTFKTASAGLSGPLQLHLLRSHSPHHILLLSI